MTTNTIASKKLDLREIPIKDLKPAKYNPRTMDDKSFDALVASIRDFGQRENVIVNADMTVISGHMRLLAMQHLGLTSAMCDVVQLSREDEKKLNLIMNSPKLQGEFDTLKVDALLAELQLSGTELEAYRLPELGTLDLSGKADDDPHAKLAEAFIIPPFSVLNTQGGDWLERRKNWRALINDEGESREGVQVGVVTDINGGTSILDPVLAEVLLRWFNIPNGTAFDPFAGDTVFGYVAASVGHKFTGIELRKEQADLNQKRVDDDKLPAKYHCDDALNMDKYVKPESQDFIFSCPPYADLEVYSTLPNDLSNMPHDEFFKVYATVLRKTYDKLKPGRFAAIVVSEVRNKQGEYIGLVPRTINIMEKAGYKYYNELILVNTPGTLRLRVARYMNSNRKIGRHHQNVLVFYKGNPKDIKKNYPALEAEQDDDSTD
jgi:DNA modification methylase